MNAGWVTTFNDYAIVSENRVTTIPKTFDLKLAPLFGCAVTTAMGVVNNDAQVKIGQSIVVFGVGGVGLNTIQGAAMVAAYPVVAIDLVDSKGCALVLTTGGTGPAPRDVTPEAIEPLFEKKMDMFAALFLMISFRKIGTSAIQSRATGGVANATYIFCLPGSPGACRDAWDEILSQQLDYRHGPCNFVEIMPRLDEHLRRPKARGASV